MELTLGGWSYRIQDSPVIPINALIVNVDHHTAGATLNSMIEKKWSNTEILRNGENTLGNAPSPGPGGGYLCPATFWMRFGRKHFCPLTPENFKNNWQIKLKNG